MTLAQLAVCVTQKRSNPNYPVYLQCSASALRISLIQFADVFHELCHVLLYWPCRHSTQQMQTHRCWYHCSAEGLTVLISLKMKTCH